MKTKTVKVYTAWVAYDTPNDGNWWDNVYIETFVDEDKMCKWMRKKEKEIIDREFDGDEDYASSYVFSNSSSRTFKIPV